MKIHIVKKGDTLFELSKKYNVALEKIISANPQIEHPDQLTIGMKVKIPSEPVAMHPETGTVYQHKVVQGDSLWKLSKAWGVPLKAMIDANSQLKNPNALLVGEIVNIPQHHGGNSSHPNGQSKAELTKPMHEGPGHSKEELTKPNEVPQIPKLPEMPPAPVLPNPSPNIPEYKQPVQYVPIPVPLPIPISQPEPQPELCETKMPPKEPCGCEENTQLHHQYVEDEWTQQEEQCVLPEMSPMPCCPGYPGLMEQPQAYMTECEPSYISPISFGQPPYSPYPEFVSPAPNAPMDPHLHGYSNAPMHHEPSCEPYPQWCVQGIQYDPCCQPSYFGMQHAPAPDYNVAPQYNMMGPYNQSPQNFSPYQQMNAPVAPLEGYTTPYMFMPSCGCNDQVNRSGADGAEQSAVDTSASSKEGDRETARTTGKAKVSNKKSTASRQKSSNRTRHSHESKQGSSRRKNPWIKA